MCLAELVAWTITSMEARYRVSEKEIDQIEDPKSKQKGRASIAEMLVTINDLKDFYTQVS